MFKSSQIFDSILRLGFQHARRMLETHRVRWGNTLSPPMASWKNNHPALRPGDLGEKTPPCLQCFTHGCSVQMNSNLPERKVHSLGLIVLMGSGLFSDGEVRILHVVRKTVDFHR